MASIDEIYSLTKYRATKNGYLGNISPSDFNLLFPRAEIRFYNLEYTKYSQTQSVSDFISKYKSDLTAISIAGTGKYTFPTDLFHVDALTHTYNGAQVEITRVEADRLANNLSSSYEAPSEEFPIYTQYSTFLQFYPTTLATANLVYLKKPVTAVWGYVLSGTIATVGTLVGGSGYPNGTWTNIVATGGSGTGARFTAVVSGGAVTSVTVTNGGTGYKIGDIFTGTIGGGTGASVTVASLSNGRPVYNAGTSVQSLLSDEDIDNVVYLLLMDIGISVRDAELEQFSIQQSKTQV